jgi:hypothetical protein
LPFFFVNRNIGNFLDQKNGRACQTTAGTAMRPAGAGHAARVDSQIEALWNIANQRNAGGTFRKVDPTGFAP